MGDCSSRPVVTSAVAPPPTASPTTCPEGVHGTAMRKATPG